MSEKINKAIEVSYQAAGAQTGLDDVKLDVYDESHALDAGKSVAAMTEIGATGRYFATFTPDAEGEWTVLMDSATTPGKVVKKYTVVAHDVDSVGDAVAVADGKVVGVAGQITALQDISTAEVNTEVDSALSDYDAPTKAELDSGLAALNDVSAADVNAQCDTALTDYDAATGAEVAALNDIDAAAVNAEVDTALSDYDVAKASDITSPPMVG